MGILPESVFAHALPWCAPLSEVAMTGSIWTTVALSLERLLVVSGRAAGASNRVGYVAGAAVVGWALFFNLPHFFSYK